MATTVECHHRRHEPGRTEAAGSGVFCRIQASGELPSLHKRSARDRWTFERARAALGAASGKTIATARGGILRHAQVLLSHSANYPRHNSDHVRRQKHLASVWKYFTYFRRMFFQLMLAKNVIEKPNVQHHNYQCYGIREIFQPRPIHELTHFSLAACKHHQWNDGKWQLQT